MSVVLPRRRRSPRIDVSIAIVNIVLLLIFFFLVTGQVTADERVEGVALPKTSALPLDQLPRPILIVESGGGLLLNGEPVAADLLGVALDALPQPVTLHLLIDRTAPADGLVALLNHPALDDRAVKLVTLRDRAAR
ncbi:biopolymer transporter ExbD (plasmid) [Paracoccus sp. TK19116]|uniref:Biopolymer transporter ExbD n=1 Tax=Paracoccus albicereus TaxID=2922394 RepID=A0ABT1MN14_9RHOB|nr:biopolymer transporter ExbD [Paracoccus albicereus]MCQ0969169.1 biopolymer transporter ExbD [Paracoccus albicereus]